MAFPALPLPAIWTVPTAIGVPALLGESVERGVSAAASTALGQIVSRLETSLAARNWGLFDKNGEPVLTAAHVWQLDFQRSFDISTAPVENGQFAAYNKVALPWVCVISFLCDGSETGGILSQIDDPLRRLIGGLTGDEGLRVRQSFFTRLEDIVQDTQLYDIRMPEQQFRNGNVSQYRFTRRVESGVTMPVAEVTIREVRSSRVTQIPATRRASAAPTIASGVVQSLPLPRGSGADSATIDRFLAGEIL